MDSKGRALDNIAIERFWRTLKQDEVYLNEYDSILEAKDCIRRFITKYNSLRPHLTLKGITPDSKYWGYENEGSTA